ncbi:1235_t:CDS:10 [Entrophospora sp. SA101]|nr:6136_t:CDS:10 [Entrophospora sp. SA101]CAJ0830344.1 1235_t:CDS:10 [Entrophospora sp. SA101]CAJ0839025.1 13116_t:CDS:10 [Entrophospora sp. SA101]
MDVTGATICDELPHPETCDIVLPNQKEYVSQIAVDIGGSLAKVVYFSRRPNSSNGGRLNFIKFETEKIDECIDFIANLVFARTRSINQQSDSTANNNNGNDNDGNDNSNGKVVIKATGGGAHKYYKIFQERLKGVKIEKEDEMECLIDGLNFLISEIPYEVFTYSEQNPMCFEGTPSNMFPYMIVNIGSGVSILKVTAMDKFERISGTSLGGGTLWGLLSLLTGAKSFDEMLESSKHGDNINDMLVGDIYGTDYSKVGLKATTIASSMGKVFKKNVRQSMGDFKSHPVTMNTLSYAINFWSNGTMKAFFLRHEGYLGTVGAFLKHRTRHRYSFSENFTMSQKITGSSTYAYGILESTPTKLVAFPKIGDITHYQPDTISLTDPQIQDCWISTLEKNENVINNEGPLQLEKQQEDNEDAKRRASTFDTLFRSHLDKLRDQPNMYGAFTVRNSLNLREHCLRELGFSDVFAKVKSEENKTALKNLPEVLNKVDSLISIDEKVEYLIGNILAGNMFDWGSDKILEMLTSGELSFSNAHNKINKTNHLNQSKRFIQAINNRSSFKKVVMFVDNSGADIILGMIPFARFFISRGSDVIFAANNHPAINDVTVMVEIDNLIAAAWASKKLVVMGTGSSGPCLDLGRIDEELANACLDVDLVVLEGMGRAIHTNYYTKFICSSLKIAVVKSSMAAIELGANIYDTVVLYEEGTKQI